MSYLIAFAIAMGVGFYLESNTSVPKIAVFAICFAIAYVLA